jgi:hypothetical protein
MLGWRDKATDRRTTGARSCSPHLPGPQVAIRMVVGVACLAFALAFAATASAAPCHDVYFISARGSGESFDGAQDLSVSPEAQAVYDGMAAQFSAAQLTPDVQIDQLAYPAPSVSLLTSGLSTGSVNERIERLLEHNLPSYLTQEREGETELEGYLQQVLTDCRSTTKTPAVVLVGYSQGAMVVHNVLIHLAGAKKTGPVRKLIRYSVLIGDPERMPASSVVNFGTAPPTSGSYGACPTLDRFSLGLLSCLPNGATQEVPKSFRARTIQVCDEDDVVCDTSSLLTPDSILAWELAFNNAVFVHTNCHLYCEAGPSTTAGNRVGKRLLRSGVVAASLSVSSVSLATATVGTPYAETLNATGGRPPYTWSTVGGPLPAGLSLESNGAIEGTPLATGTTDVTFEVTDKRGRTASATLPLTVQAQPNGLRVFRTSGPAGFVSDATKVECPTASAGETMWMTSEGAGGATGELSSKIYPGEENPIWVYTATDLSPNSYQANISCVESPSSTTPTGGTAVKTYTFTQTITAPASKPVVTPTEVVPGQTMTVEDGGGCGNETSLIQDISIFVFNSIEGGPGFEDVQGASADPLGHWGPISFNSPVGPKVSWNVQVFCQSTGKFPDGDESFYASPVAVVPVA